MESSHVLFEVGLARLEVQSGGLVPRRITDGHDIWTIRMIEDVSLDRVPRRYVNDGLAKELELNFPPLTQARLNTVANALALWLSRQ